MGQGLLVSLAHDGKTMHDTDTLRGDRRRHQHSSLYTPRSGILHIWTRELPCWQNSVSGSLLFDLSRFNVFCYDTGNRRRYRGRNRDLGNTSGVGMSEAQIRITVQYMEQAC